jgi:hypothetical protein
MQHPPSRTGSPRDAIAVRCPAGPDAGWSTYVAPGAHWLGRAGGAIRVADPTVEPHHALVDVGPDGSVAILQTSGRTSVRVDGEPTSGWTRVRAGSTVEVGASRFVFGTSTAIAASPMVWVFAPHGATATEHSRFERDVQLAADAARYRRSRRPSTDAVELGTADVDVPIDIRDADGRTVAVGALDLAAQAIVERCSRTTLPLWASISVDARIAIVAADPEAVADGLVAQLPPDRRSRVLVLEPDDAMALAGSGSPMFVLARDRHAVPSCCRSLLEVGDTWRGMWWEDVHRRPHRMYGLHVRGPTRTPRTSRSWPAPGDTTSADVDRPFVAQQVARAGAEGGGGIVGVPETTRRQ